MINVAIEDALWVARSSCTDAIAFTSSVEIRKKLVFARCRELERRTE
jgi:hypothetical protein